MYRGIKQRVRVLVFIGLFIVYVIVASIGFGIGYIVCESWYILLRLFNIQRNIYYREGNESIPLKCRLHLHEFKGTPWDSSETCLVRICNGCGIRVNNQAFYKWGNFLKDLPITTASLEELPKYLTDENCLVRKMAAYRFDKLSRSR